MDVRWELDYKESWAPKNWCFWSVVLRRFLGSLLKEVPWTARRFIQSSLKEINPEYSLEGLMLKVQYCGHLIHRTESLEKTWCWERLKVLGEGDDRGWDGWIASPTQWTWVWVTPGVCDGQGGLAYCSPWGWKEWNRTEWLKWSNWRVSWGDWNKWSHI